MADFGYTYAKSEREKGNISWTADSIRALIVMTNTTADTEKNVTNLGAFTDIDEFNGANYARIVLSGRTVTPDNTNLRANIDCDDVVFNAADPQLGNGARQIQAIIIYKHVGADSVNIPIYYIDSFGSPFDPASTKQTFVIDPSGLVQRT